MPLNKAVEKYLVTPGSKLNFQDLDPSTKELFEHGGKEESQAVFAKLQSELCDLQKVLYAENKHRVLVVIQAMDTGGKDGCVRNVFSGMDPQGVEVKPFKKPSEEELAHDFLWRVHQKVPRNGEIVIFNRSHYEDILAVKVKKLLPDHVWQQRFRHIVEFERMLAEEGTTIVKIFLNISKQEQKKRLESRLANPDKHWKFNPDDLEDRARWPEFMETYEELIERTSTQFAPWYIVPADRKWYRNLVVGSIIKQTLENLNMEYPEITWDPSSMEIGD